MNLKNTVENTTMIACLCDSKNPFSECCKPYLVGTKHAESPEKLMRSRYCAYTYSNIDYIQKTMRKKAAENFDPVSAKNWSSSVMWLGLTVIDAPLSKDQFGTVTFFARFLDNRIKKTIFEKSQFEKIDEQWFYVDGTMLKVSRNEDCPCGSKKKFKRCCA